MLGNVGRMSCETERAGPLFTPLRGMALVESRA